MVSDEEETASSYNTYSNISSSKTSKDLFKQRRVSENFFAMPGAALILPKHSILMAKNLQAVTKFGGELQTHLHAIFRHLRAQDTIKLAVRLESWVEDHRRYLVIISTTGRQDTEESIIVGCDFESRDSTTCTIGLVLPLWSGTNIRLDGDGRFHIEFRDQCMHTFKPVSVQAMWSALQSLHRCLDVARRNNYYEGSLYLTWTGFYTSKVSSERVYVNEWNYREDLAARNEYFSKPDPERLPIEKIIRTKLKAVMMDMDLDSCTSRQIRQALESQVAMDLKEYKEYIDSEMLKVLGEMDCSSKILDYLYLGSEWNASNLEELEELGVTHILNVTMEIDNFFPNNFRYKSVRLYDDAESDLLPHWNHTWRFIEEARKVGGKCLVHCRMGISRSSATVCAYLMKSKFWGREKALSYVQSCRPIADPNPGFRRQLEEYEGILSASAQRHNKLFRSRSENNVSDSEDGGSRLTVLSPRAAPNHAPYRDVMGGAEDFDLNRRLLDITNLIAPQSARAKSWSPEEGETRSLKCCKLSHGQQKSSDVLNRYFRIKNFSEPVEFLTTPCGDSNRIKKLRENRRNFFNKRARLRRNTVGALLLGGSGSDDLAHSDESVFVCDGYFPPRWHQDKGSSKKRANAAEIRAPKRNIDNQTLSTSDSSIRRKAPARKNQEAEVFEADSSTSLVLNDVSGGQGGIEIPIAIPVREIVAVIESPSDDVYKLARLASASNLKSMGGEEFVKGHYKTSSLPAAPRPSHSESVLPICESCDRETASPRDRSLSETQTSLSVKKIITAIESGNLQENEPPGEVPVSAVSCWASVSKRSPSVEAIPSNQDAASTRSDPKFYVGGSGMLLEEDKPHLSANTNNNHSPPSNSVTASIDDVVDVKITRSVKVPPHKPSFFSPFPPTILRVIEKVGLQLMKNSGGNTVTSSVSDDSKASLSCSENSASKKRGVRQMVREIERSVRKLRKGNLKSGTKSVPESVAAVPPSSPVFVPAADQFSTPIIDSPSIYPDFDDVFPDENSFHSDVHVRDLVDRFDENPPTSSPVKKLVFDSPSFSPHPPAGEVISFASPQPYQTFDRSSGNLAKFKTWKLVRRSHSDRCGKKSSLSKHVVNSRSFRMPRNNLYSVTHGNHQITSKYQNPIKATFDGNSNVTLSTKVSPSAGNETRSPIVRKMVTDIEKKFTPSSSSSVHRSSSMPSSKPSKTSSKSLQFSGRKSLRKSKSSSFLKESWPGDQSLSSD